LGSTKQITGAEFEQEVLQAKSLVIVDFSAPWCPPCRRLEPELEAVATELGEKIKIVKMNVDEEEAISVNYNVSTIPNMTYFKDGKVVDQVVGMQPKRDILARIKNHIQEPVAK
jgi:thioredoxin 1